MKDWVTVIELHYPSINPLIFPTTDSEVWHEWSSQEALASRHCNLFVKTPRIREIIEVLNLHAEVEQGIKRKSNMVAPTAAISTFMTSLPDSDKEILPPMLVLAGNCILFHHFQCFVVNRQTEMCNTLCDEFRVIQVVPKKSIEEDS